VTLEGLADAVTGAPVSWRGEPAESMASGAAVELAVRPEALSTVPEATPGAVDGTVTDRRYAGPLTYVTVMLGSGALASGVEVEVLVPGAAACRAGDRVRVAPSSAGPLPRILPRAAQ
jgi:hypothetical protein